MSGQDLTPAAINQLRNLDSWGDAPPYELGHELLLRASGGAHLHDKQRLSIARDVHRAHVEGDRVAEITGNQSLETQFNLSTQVNGSDSLTVNGSASIKARERIIIGTGNVTRSWTGPMMRTIGMEGVIAGGMFTKAYVGSTITLAPLATGDVYGGGLHAAAVRIHLSGKIGYRSAERAMWTGGMQIRNTAMTIEPLVGSKLMDPPRHWALKAGRIGLAMCPLLDILWGVGTMPIMIALSIYAIVKNWKKPPQPPAGPPRVHNRTVGAWVQTRASDKTA